MNNNDEKTNKELKRFIKKTLANVSGNQLEYFAYSKDREKIKKIMCAFINVTCFEAPDGYYYDSIIKTLYIFEHFEFDCSPSKRKSSKLQESQAKVNKTINEGVVTSMDDVIDFTNIIEQGYSESINGNITYHIGENGDKYRDNYISNFSRSFLKHNRQIENYKINCSNEIKKEIKEIVTIFVIEDVTQGGTYYLTKAKNKGDAVNLFLTKQFVEIVENSKVDYVIFRTFLDNTFTIFDKNIINDKSKENLIDLKEKEFFVFPAMLMFTSIKHRKI